MNKKLVLSAVLLSGGLSVGLQPAWSQSPPSTPETKEAYVIRVETILLEKGFDPGKVDGVMDRQTTDAIRAFQKANNLQVTGKIDQATAEKLGVSFRESGDFYRAE